MRLLKVTSRKDTGSKSSDILVKMSPSAHSILIFPVLKSQYLTFSANAREDGRV
jgi:hypothetical protein